ncbi:MAG: cytidylate kinase family protein [Halanaerobiales bacterium]
MSLITISRQTASLGDQIAEELAQRLGMKLITRDYVLEKWLSEIASKHELHMLQESSKFYNKTSSKGLTFAEFIENKLKKKAKKESMVILGLGSQVIFRDSPEALHVKIVSSENNRVKRIAGKYGLNPEQAQRTVELSDRKHRRYVWRIYDRDWSEPTLYHLALNTDGINIEEAVNLLIYLADLKKENMSALTAEIEAEKKEKNEEPNFVHPSEKELADILNMHNIKWEYEPTEFPLEWDAEGNITMGFRPDFYLPEYDTFIELTTMKRKYVTEKNKKKRLLEKKYPEVNIKIVYKKDFKSLIERFGVEPEGD